MDIAPGYCLCGCGQQTRVAPGNDRSKGWIKGVPVSFIKGHHLKLDKAGPKSPRWKGGRQKCSHGYVMLWTPEGSQYEHILVAQKAVGRKLRQIRPGHPDNEVVHHIDGNKLNNRPENLLVCTHSYHIELHHRLELSPDWPEFQKVVRNTKEKSNERHNCQGI